MTDFYDSGNKNPGCDDMVLSLAIQSTTLDDVFVQYTGRQLRDALQAPPPSESPVMTGKRA